jgi:enamine deaminase RidA (YjgF/YER057c/UK114 family)
MRPFALVLVLLATACSSSRSAPEEPMQHLNAPGRTDTLPFSHGVLAGDFLFLAGTLGLDSTGKPPADAGEEARAMLDDF